MRVVVVGDELLEFSLEWEEAEEADKLIAKLGKVTGAGLLRLTVGLHGRVLVELGPRDVLVAPLTLFRPEEIGCYQSVNSSPAVDSLVALHVPDQPDNLSGHLDLSRIHSFAGVARLEDCVLPNLPEIRIPGVFFGNGKLLSSLHGFRSSLVEFRRHHHHRGA